MARFSASPGGLDPHRFPVDIWQLIEREPDARDLGVTETLFALGNGYLGMRATPAEGREAHLHGTYVNGFHETWQIRHAEEAYAFAKTGQTIINVPDPKLIKLYVDDEPLLLTTAELEHYERVLDLRTGMSWREIIWRTPGAKRVRVRSERLVSIPERHIALLTFEITMLDGDAPIVISSQLLNRQDGEDEYHVRTAALGEGLDPRRARTFAERVLVPRLQYLDGRTPEHGRPTAGDEVAVRGGDGGEVILGYRCANSAMTLACGYQHVIDTDCEYVVDTVVEADLAKSTFSFTASAGQRFRLIKYVSYHTSTGVPAEELADRCHRSLRRARSAGRETIVKSQADWLQGFWERSDIEIDGDDALQQAVRWNLFQLAQATASSQEQGVAAKGVTGGGYDGHYFWDTEVYVVPFLAYTNPDLARKVLRFRWRMLPQARQRARELNQVGALYPWRTINGEEASAYYAAGTAQYHINAAVAYALEQYLFATGDMSFLVDEGAEILVETARLWHDLGFYHRAPDGSGMERFHIHGVTGPDEYTTVVNDNFYTNVMARFNLRYAAATVTELAESDPGAYATLCRRTGLDRAEIDEWRRAGDAMYLPFDDALGIHPQDDSFLDREPWDFDAVPADRYPLLLHFHPLVIYRHQVLKQADVVLAMYLRSAQFDLDQIRRNFDYYDPLTTGDSSLSAGVQSIVAARVGYRELAMQYFRQALFVDLCDTHGNTDQGVHVASAGAVWAALVHGFGGLHDNGEHLSFTPSLPEGWTRLSFPLVRRASRLRVDVDHLGAQVTVVDGDPVPISTGDDVVLVGAGTSIRLDAPLRAVSE